MKISDLKNNFDFNSQILPQDLVFLAKKCFNEHLPDILENFHYSKTGLPIYREESGFVHSTVDPLTEAKRLIVLEAVELNNRLIVLPADLLYALEYALNKRAVSDNVVPDLLVILCYEDLKHFLTCWSLRPYAFLKKTPFVIHIPEVCPLSETDLKVETAKGNYFIHNITYQRTKKKIIEKNKKLYYQFMSDWYASLLTKFYFEKKWILNGLINLKLNDFRKLSDLKKIVSSGSCHIVGAGPSLSRGLIYLKKIKKKGIKSTILCLDTALMALLLEGIEPDFVVTLDSGYANSLDFEILPSSKCSLIADISTHPAMFKHFEGKKYLFVSTGIGKEIRKINDKTHPPESKEKLISYLCDSHDLCDENPLEGVPVVPSHGSVVHPAYYIALYMGFSEITFHGLDFSSPFFDSHIYGGAHFNYHYFKSNRLSPISSQDFKMIEPSLKNEMKESPSGSFFYKETKLYEYGKKLIETLSKNITHFSSSIWGLRLEGVSYLKDDNDVSTIHQTNINIENEIKIRNNLENGGGNFLKVNKKKYIELISLKSLLIQSLQVIEKKKLEEFEKINAQLLKCFDTMHFLNDVLRQLEFYLNRRHGENRYQQYYYLYKELFKFVHVIEQKIVKDQ